MSLLYIMENSSKIKEFCTEALKAYLEALESEKIKNFNLFLWLHSDESYF